MGRLRWGRTCTFTAPAVAHLRQEKQTPYYGHGLQHSCAIFGTSPKTRKILKGFLPLAARGKPWNKTASQMPSKSQVRNCRAESASQGTARNQHLKVQSSVAESAPKMILDQHRG